MTKTSLPENLGTQGPSIPVSAIVVILIQSLLTIHLIYFGVSILVETREDYRVGPAIWPFPLSRLVIALGVLIELSHRRYIARKISRGVCTLGLIFSAVVIISILTVGVTSLHQYELLKFANAQCLVFCPARLPWHEVSCQMVQ